MPEWHLPVGPFLAAPVIMSGAVVGLIAVANSENPTSKGTLRRSSAWPIFTRSRSSDPDEDA